MSSTTVVNTVDRPRPAPAAAVRPVYTGGALARTVTSSQLVPTESLISQRGGATELRERDRDREGLEAGLTRQVVDEKGERRVEQEGGDDARDDVVVTDGKEGVAEEWTFPDGGWRAWSVVFGCWLYSCNVQGYGMAWGALVGDLRKKHHPDTDLATLNLIVGLFNFGLNASPFITGRLGELFGFKRMIAIGSTISVCLLVISACAVDSLPALFVCQGFLLGCAHGISLPLFMTIPSQWFSKRRGLATGITVSGAGFGGGAASLILRGILPSLGYRYSLLVYAGISTVTYVVGWMLLKVRKPPLRAVPQRFDTKTGLPPGIWRDGAFYSLMASVSIGVWGFLSPFYYLTEFTTKNNPSLDPNSLVVAIPLIVGNFALAIGRVGAGLFADRIGPANAMFLTFFAGGILQLAFWSQLGEGQFGATVAFAVLFGLFGSSFFLLMPAVASQLFGLRGLATITGWVVTSQSPGQLAGATVAGVVLSSAGGYTGVAYYAGAMMLGGAVLVLPARFLRERRLFARY